MYGGIYTPYEKRLLAAYNYNLFDKKRLNEGKKTKIWRVPLNVISSQDVEPIVPEY